MFNGSFVALITPFRNGGVDETRFQDFVAWQVDQGTHGLVPTGTTGEEFGETATLVGVWFTVTLTLLVVKSPPESVMVAVKS